mmetsp:Transcript_72476/g.172779  ORF Transcript_72476/g.172779 Transcript_72476/m.172779 type:complete len:241 (-) Transcript_72476:832-1554(-)
MQPEIPFGSHRLLFHHDALSCLHLHLLLQAVLEGWCSIKGSTITILANPHLTDWLWCQDIQSDITLAHVDSNPAQAGQSKPLPRDSSCIARCQLLLHRVHLTRLQRLGCELPPGLVGPPTGRERCLTLTKNQSLTPTLRFQGFHIHQNGLLLAHFYLVQDPPFLHSIGVKVLDVCKCQTLFDWRSFVALWDEARHCHMVLHHKGASRLNQGFALVHRPYVHVHHAQLLVQRNVAVELGAQ